MRDARDRENESERCERERERERERKMWDERVSERDVSCVREM